MNLFRAISLGGGAGDLRSNDSTVLICHVQLFVLAIDWILNIIVDNFLKDPLVVLIMFICQALLLTVGLIFYLMASANQAMKEGIDEKILRHHQTTVGLWTIYFSTLVCWYIWTLKRSWPSAGEHFSFTFSEQQYRNPLQDNIKATTAVPYTNITDSISTAKTLYGSTTTNATGVPSPVSTTSVPKTNNSISLAQFVPADALTSVSINEVNESIGNADGTGGYRNNSEENPKKEESHGDDNLKFFWSSGFIVLYVIERSVSLLFYVVYILGTLHIVNFNVLDGGHMEYEVKNPGYKNQDRRTTGRRDNHAEGNKPTVEFMESDNNMDDDFIRRLEDQDADPFNNEQYDYQYKISSSGKEAYERFDQDNDSSDNVLADLSDKTMPISERGNRRRKHKKAGSGGGGGLNKNIKEKLPKTRGALHNMMIMSNIKRQNDFTSKPESSDWFNSSNDTDIAHSSSFFKDPTFSSTDTNFRRGFVEEAKMAPETTSSSIDTMGTGSTDELLVAHVFTRDDKIFPRPQAFQNNERGRSDENLYPYTY